MLTEFSFFLCGSKFKDVNTKNKSMYIYKYRCHAGWVSGKSSGPQKSQDPLSNIELTNPEKNLKMDNTVKQLFFAAS